MIGVMIGDERISLVKLITVSIDGGIFIKSSLGKYQKNR
jgi:hypothetical protein